MNRALALVSFNQFVFGNCHVLSQLCDREYHKSHSPLRVPLRGRATNCDCRHFHQHARPIWQIDSHSIIQLRSGRACAQLFNCNWESSYSIHHPMPLKLTTVNLEGSKWPSIWTKISPNHFFLPQFTFINITTCVSLLCHLKTAYFDAIAITTIANSMYKCILDLSWFTQFYVKSRTAWFWHFRGSMGSMCIKKWHWRNI